jgi:two-component system, chemotaxis family, CheB/CheR fusion protein
MNDVAESRDFEALLEYLKRTRGFDFSAYRRPSLVRRVQKRLEMVGCSRFGDYTDYLEVHPEEFGLLFNVILINVTAFFRDDTTWDFVRDTVVPEVVGAPSDSEPVRIWSAGCASGEEAYSLAMLLAEALGPDRFRDRVKIYATDVDEQALAQARQARYTEKEVQPVPPPLRERYFAQEGDRFVFDKDLRRSVIIGRHDLIQDAPISRINLLVCRNTLMYFNTEAQARILARYHFALARSGVLFVGKAEMLTNHVPQLFAPIDPRSRVFRKVSKDGWRDRLAIMTQANGEASAVPLDPDAAMHAAAFDAGSHAQIVIDAGGFLTMFNDRARTLFNITPSDVGRPIQDLVLSYRPIDLRSLIDQAIAQCRAIVVTETEWDPLDGESRHFDVAVTPLEDGGGRPAGVSLAFVDTSRAHRLQMQLDRTKQDLDTAYEELQSTNEELETTNEELQSTVEELETTNEELQSTNEELETMNEELQSTNEELHSINEELRDRSGELKSANSFLESILTGVRAGVIVVDREFRVIAWNHRSEDLWGLRRDEARGQNFLSLDIGLPVEELRTAIRACIAGDSGHLDTRVRAVNRRGRPIDCRVSITPLLRDTREVHGAILIAEEESADVRSPVS